MSSANMIIDLRSNGSGALTESGIAHQVCLFLRVPVISGFAKRWVGGRLGFGVGDGILGVRLVR